MADLDLSGRRLGDFVLRERIGQGGYGAVYRCEQPQLHRHAVVKVLHARLREDDIALQRFMREAQLASLLDHPYAAHIYSFGVEGEDGLPWIAMELVQGVTLNRWLELRGPMPLEQFVPFFECVAQVVQVAHERGIIHRDLKPSNMMVIERAGYLFPKLLDFGIAKMASDVTPAHPFTWPEGSLAEVPRRVGPVGDGAITERIRATPLRRASIERARSPRMIVAPDRQRITRSETGIGSPAYMSPEQWTNAVAVGPPADLYALGVVAHEVLAGRLPFTGVTNEDYYHQHCSAPVPPLGLGFPPGLDVVFQRALAKRPDHRYANALEFAAALRAELRTQPREQVRVAAQQWLDRGRPSSLLWRGDVLAELERSWAPLPTVIALSEPDASFLAASRKLARRAARKRKLLAVLGVAAALGAVEYRAAMQTRVAELKTAAAEQLVVQAEVEQGRQALLHDELADAQRHLLEAYRHGDRSDATLFMLSRALQPRLAEQAKFQSTSGRMWSAAFSPDGKQIVTTDDHNAQIWDAVTHQRRFVLAHTNTVYSAAFSADGSRVATASADGTVKLWNTANGSLVHELTVRRADEKPSLYFCVAVSPDGKRVAAIDTEGDVAHVWDALTGAVLAELENDGEAYALLKFSPDGRWLVTNGGSDARVFDTSSWKRVATIVGPQIRGIAFEPNGSHLVTGSQIGDVSIWSLPDGRRVRRFRELGDPIDIVSWSPDGAMIATASRDGAELVFDAVSGSLRSRGNFLHDRIFAIEFDPSSTLLLAAGANGTAVISDAAFSMPIATLEGPRAQIRNAHFDASGRHVVGASWDGTVRLWDATPTYRRWGAPPVDKECGAITTIEPDRRFVAVVCHDRPTQVWDTARGQLLAALPSSPVDGNAGFWPPRPAVSAAGDLAAIPHGNEVSIYGLPGGVLLRTIRRNADVTAIAFAMKGHGLVTGAADGSIIVTRDDEEWQLPKTEDGVDSASFLFDGRVVVAAGNRLRFYAVNHVAGHQPLLADLELAGRVQLLRPSADSTRLITISRSVSQEVPPLLWDLQTMKAVAKLEGHVGEVFSARFVDGEHQILTSGSDGTARRWSSATGQLQQVYRAGLRYIADAALSPDGAMVITGGADGLMRFWDAASGRQLWKLPAHETAVIGLHFEGESIVSRGFSGAIARWTLSQPPAVIQACRERQGCDTLP